MPIVVGVAFRPVTKVYFFDPGEFTDLRAGEHVVAETSRGRTMGEVVFAPKEVPDAEIAGALKPVVRRASAWDMVQADQMAHREPEALQAAREKAAALRMDIKVVRVEFGFDGSSAVVYFTSEQRVDFRNLVHELSAALRARVEMRQVGVRDEAKFVGGFGKCGRELCCASWLREFAPVSIKMAKTQDLPLNAPEVSGLCGRLLCCLAYENDFYAEARKQMPRANSIVETPQGPGKVRQVHVLANSITVLVEGPNEQRTYVQMEVPEPLSALSPHPLSMAPRTQEGEDVIADGEEFVDGEGPRRDGGSAAPGPGSEQRKGKRRKR